MGNETKASNLSEACGTILAKICYQVADEIGKSFAERASAWRAKNASLILEEAEAKYKAISRSGKEHASPRLIHMVLDKGSWVDDSEMHEMWAGLLATSCTDDGRDESNLLFMNILGQLTSLQVKVLNYACQKVLVSTAKGGWIMASGLVVALDELVEITGVDDFHRIDRELDHMRDIGLGQIGFHPGSKDASIYLSSVALQMYAKCQGFNGAVEEFYNIDIADGIASDDSSVSSS